MKGSIGERVGTKRVLVFILVALIGVLLFLGLIPATPTQSELTALLETLVTFDGVMIGFILVLAVDNLEKLQTQLDTQLTTPVDLVSAKRIAVRKSNRRTDLTTLVTFVGSTFTGLVIIGASGQGINRIYLFGPLFLAAVGLGLILLRLAFYVDFKQNPTLGKS
jgi:hypothetical protein